MPVRVYRCSHCGREVLVRELRPDGTVALSEAEIARRIEQEHRPSPRGLFARGAVGMRLRDDVWVGISGLRTFVPREALPEQCPACQRPDTLAEVRLVEEE